MPPWTVVEPTTEEVARDRRRLLPEIGSGRQKEVRAVVVDQVLADGVTGDGARGHVDPVAGVEGDHVSRPGPRAADRVVRAVDHDALAVGGRSDTVGLDTDIVELHRVVAALDVQARAAGEVDDVQAPDGAATGAGGEDQPAAVDLHHRSAGIAGLERRIQDHRVGDRQRAPGSDRPDAVGVVRVIRRELELDGVGVGVARIQVDLGDLVSQRSRPARSGRGHHERLGHRDCSGEFRGVSRRRSADGPPEAGIVQVAVTTWPPLSVVERSTGQRGRVCRDGLRRGEELDVGVDLSGRRRIAGCTGEHVQQVLTGSHPRDRQSDDHRIRPRRGHTRDRRRR